MQFVEDSKAISEILSDNQGSIHNYLRSNNPDAAAPGGVSTDAIDAFTKSCAGYCVITYSRRRKVSDLDAVNATHAGTCSESAIAI